MVDLHCHSNFSDGVLSPVELYDAAYKSGVKYLSLTDHDTIAGLDGLHFANLSNNLTIINGIELSVKWKKYNLHILGLNINPNHAELLNIIEKQSASRIERAEAIADLLAKCGIENAYDKALQYAKNHNIGRPHFAKVLLAEGFVTNLQEAFTNYLGERKKAYVSTSWISLEEAVSVIIAAGGDAVIAHPLKYKLTRTKLLELVEYFKSIGGNCLEVISGNMLQDDITLLANVCCKFDLLASSGSDFHGEKMSKIQIGKQKVLPTELKPIWHKWS
ncbi:MAG: phosphatase [Legionellales bacterium RIFCSPHIGHO2_12_FULL_35_11]|nr:MAG: phosphatase [Legionellales bacterium RIFCSPHIGHO2_12_FULL_35_11]